MKKKPTPPRPKPSKGKAKAIKPEQKYHLRSSKGPYCTFVRYDDGAPAGRCFDIVQPPLPGVSNLYTVIRIDHMQARRLRDFITSHLPPRKRNKGASNERS